MLKKQGTDMEIYKSNTLIESTHKMTLNESKIFGIAVGHLDPFDSNQSNTVRVLKETLFTCLGISSDKTKYNELKNTCKSMQTKSFITLLDGKQEVNYCVVPVVKWSLKEDWVDFKFEEELMPHLTKLSREFTHYNIGSINGMKSKYGIRLYEIFRRRLLQNEDKDFVQIDWTFSMEELRRYTDTKEKYALFGKWEERVLTPALNDINTESELIVSILKKIKRGRSIVAVQFEIFDKNKRIKQLQLDSKPIVAPVSVEESTQTVFKYNWIKKDTKDY